MLTPDQCPDSPEETAEAYLLHHLTPADEQAFEDHFVACARCLEVLERTRRYAIAMKQAAKNFQDE